MQNLIVSMIRFSTAVTLWGWDQVQRSFDVLEGGEDLNQSMDRISKSLNSVTDTLMHRVDSQKRDTLNSVAKMSRDVVDRTFDSMDILDPREMARATNNMVQSMSNATADWVTKTAKAVDEETERVTDWAADTAKRTADRTDTAKEKSERKHINIDDMTVEEVLEAVDNGDISASEALRQERKGKNRTTLITSLESKATQ